MTSTLVDLDPTTFEILVNRLRTINESQALLAKRISGSAVIYESGDFNAAIMDSSGDTVFLGHHNLMLGAALDLGVKWLQEHYSTEPGINPGDVFYHNDPWIGTVHQQDGVALAPVFIDDELVCWLGMAMHELDVGGVVPGSFAVGATETFAESSILPPVKIVEGGALRPDIERAIVRNSRLPNLLSLDLRARLGAFSFATQAIRELADKYGVGSLVAAIRQVKTYVSERLGVRLDAIPDGTWRRIMYIDGDGITDDARRAELSLTKQGRSLRFDFGGTSPQAPSGINITRTGLQGVVNVGLLCTLCYDLPWATSAFSQYVTIEVDEGTMFTAVSPAPVSGGTVSCGTLAATLVQSATADMLTTSPTLRQEAMAVWQPFWNGTIINGIGSDGKPVTGMIMDGMLGGEGASTARDGQDVGGRYSGISLEAANVERNEHVLPVLQLARRISPESCGHGEHRGGAGTIIVMTPHKTIGELRLIIYSAYQEQIVPGLAGGGGPAAQGNLIARATNLQDMLLKGSVPTSLDEVKAKTVERLPSKCITNMARGDIQIMVAAGGGGYGDPLRRDPLCVESDVRAGEYGTATAREIYGCAFDASGRVNVDVTDGLRTRMRQERLQAARPVRDLLSPHVTYSARDRPAERCRHCGADLGAGDPRLNAATCQRRLSPVGPLDHNERSDLYRCWEFYCPKCGTLFDSAVLEKDDPLELVFETVAPETVLRHDAIGIPVSEVEGTEMQQTDPCEPRLSAGLS